MSADLSTKPKGSRTIAREVLFGVLERAARVTLVSASADSGKTVLLRSWIKEQGLERHAAWLFVERDEHDPQKFWTSVVEALRATSALLQRLEPTPSLERLAATVFPEGNRSVPFLSRHLNRIALRLNQRPRKSVRSLLKLLT